MDVRSDITSPYYPYFKVRSGFGNFKQYAAFPRKICDYLIDAPDPGTGYEPIDGDEYPRSRLWKRIYYDGARPLSEPLPTIQQKMSVLFDPDRPTDPPTPKGYRLIPQEYIKQAQTEAQTRIYVYMGRLLASKNDSILAASVIFDVFTHYTYELNMKTDEYSRSGAIVADILDALDGVNITGIGTFSLSKALHPDCGDRPIFDGDTNVGHQLIIGLALDATTLVENDKFENLPPLNESGTIRLA